jgi:hypothetical protein
MSEPRIADPRELAPKQTLRSCGNSAGSSNMKEPWVGYPRERGVVEIHVSAGVTSGVCERIRLV